MLTPGSASFDAIECSAGDTGPIGHGLGGITPAQSGDTKALTQRGELAGRRREKRGSGSRHYVSYFDQNLAFLPEI
jgi:hypothetical protein